MHQLFSSHNNKYSLRMFLSHVASLLEILLAVLLAGALTLCILQLIPSLLKIRVSVQDADMFHHYLESLFVIVIGVEALKLLCTHTPGAALEVILFTIARDMIITHTTPVENLLTVISIGLLFAIRKFLMVPSWESDHFTPGKRSTKNSSEDS